MITKNLTNNATFKQSLAKAQNNRANSNVTYKKKPLPYEYGVSYPMVVTNIKQNKKGYVFETDIFTGTKTVKDNFFFTDNPQTTFLEDFMGVVTPDSEDINDVIGTPFEGEVVQKNGYTNLKAIDTLDMDEDDDFDEEEE